MVKQYRQNMERLITSNVKSQAEKEFGARLGKSIAKACSSTISKQPAPRITKTTHDIPIEKIVRENIRRCEREEMAMVKAAQNAVFSCVASSATSGESIATQIVASIRIYVENVEERALHPYKIVLEIADVTRKEMGIMNIQSLLQDMVEQCALLGLYRSKVQELKFELKDKDKVIEKIKLTMEQNNVNCAVPDTALKIAAVIESEDEDSVVLASLLKDLIQNRGTPNKRWSDATKSLFAIILDYGGPALARIVQEKIGCPSLQSMYRTARSNYAIPCKLEEQALRHARSFYDTIGYNGVFALAVDATAVVPTMRVKGNKITGLATERDVIVSSAQDILNVVKNREYELAKQANVFIVAPLQDHVPQDYTLIRHWCNQATLWGARNKITIVGADRDSKFRKYYVERLTNPRRKK